MITDKAAELPAHHCAPQPSPITLVQAEAAEAGQESDGASEEDVGALSHDRSHGDDRDRDYALREGEEEQADDEATLEEEEV